MTCGRSIILYFLCTGLCINAQIGPKNLYRNLPNRGAGRDSKVNGDMIGQKLRFWDSEIRIENRSIIKGITAILVPLDNIGSP